MTESFDLRDPERFTAGTVGPPGQRVFYLQAVQDGRCVTLRLEKQQVAALCEHLSGMMADLPDVEPEEGGAEAWSLVEPLESAWTVGAMGVAYEQRDDRIVLVAEELVVVAIDDDLDDDDLDLLDIGDLNLDELDEPTPATARFHLRRSMVPGFIRHGLSLTAAGRPDCDLCGRPVDPAGHACPRLN
jgi:uncharacterized repeat protein (TIGR03847 family)